ncbi:MAG: hypothetical protein RR365_14155 [Bacteroides sp.]
MVKTHKNSRIALYNLTQIRDSKEIILQVENTETTFTDGHKCYLCEVVAARDYNYVRFEQDYLQEICQLNRDKRELEKRISRLEKQLKRVVADETN